MEDDIIEIVAENKFLDVINGDLVDAKETGEEGMQVQVKVKVEHDNGYASLDV